MKKLTKSSQLRNQYSFREAKHSQRYRIKKKNHYLEAHCPPKLPFHAFDICTFQGRVSSKMTGYQKHALIKNVFKPGQYFSFPVTERNFVFSWINKFPWLCYSRWEDGDYCLQRVLFAAKYPGKKLTNFFLNHIEIAGTHVNIP